MDTQPNGTALAQLRVVVTGGSAGIGRSIVETFAREGHHVLFTYLSGVEASCELEEKYGKAVTKTQLDQGCVASVAAFGETVAGWCGDNGVDVLINNAALGSATVRGYMLGSADKDEPKATNGDRKNVTSFGKFNAEQAAEDLALMRVNALGPLWVTEAIDGSLRKGSVLRGRSIVIFIGSVGGGSNGVFPEYRCSDLMSKAAMTYLVKHLAAQYIKDPIDIVCVAPGATETAMFQQSTLSKVRDVNAFIASMPKQQLIQPKHVADVVLWLATNDSARILHGAVLDASFGLAVRPGLQTESAQSRK